MPEIVNTRSLAATGTTGNNTGAGVVVDLAQMLVIDFIVEVAGATPTITVTPQGSLDGSNWFAIPFVIENTTAVVTTARTVTAVGHYLLCIDMLQPGRAFNQVRIVSSANTNITYSANSYSLIYPGRDV